MIKKIAAVFREFGPAAGLLYLSDQALSAVTPELRLHFYELMVQPVSVAPVLAIRASRSSFEVRPIMPGDPILESMPIPHAVIESRFSQGATCLGAFRADCLTAYMWYCDGGYDEDEVRCTYQLTPSEESVFDYDFYIFPKYRLSRVFASLWSGAIEILQSRGVRYSFSRLARFNLASRRAHAHLGLRLVGRALFLKAWRLECLVATVRPYVALTVTGRPHLDLRAGDAT